MSKNNRFFSLRLGLIALSFLILTSNHGSASASYLFAPDQLDDSSPDAPWVLLSEDDLPGFHEVDETAVAGPLALAKRLASALAGPNAAITNVTHFRADDPFGSAFIFSFLAYPLSEDKVTNFNALTGDAALLRDALTGIARSSGAEVEPIPIADRHAIGEASIGFAFRLGEAPVASNVDALWVRRGEILQLTWVMYPAEEAAPVDVLQVGRHVDQQVADKFTGTIFRPPAKYVPYLAIHLPTPLDVSTDPVVISANLLLAAVMMLPFAAAVELFTQLISEQETSLSAWLRSRRWFSRRRRARPDDGGERPRGLIRLLRVTIIMLFYGTTFSLLDPSWRPFSITGALLLFNMTLAYGIVGIAADFLQYRALRKWGKPARLSLRPTNIFLAMGSTVVSRLFALVPGMMFGTPQALVVDEDALKEDQRGKLLRISAITMLSIGLGLWALTSFTTLLRRGVLEASAADLVGGIEALLLIVFAVALENSFVAMLGFPGSLGAYIRRSSFAMWFIGMIGITFVFFHTLINPRGDLAQAIQDANTLLLLGVTGGFVLLTLLWRLVTRRRVGADSEGEKAARTGERKEVRSATPVWVWFAMVVVVVMVVGTFWVEQLPGLPIRSSFDDHGEGGSVESPASGPIRPVEVEGIEPVLDLPPPSGGLCYVPSGDLSASLLDQSAWRGVQLVAAQYGMHATAADPGAYVEDGYYQSVVELAERDCDLIIGLSFLSAPLQNVAADFPDQTILLLGSPEEDPAAPNLWVVAYDLDQGSYLAGYLAAAVSEMGRVGTFGTDSTALQSSVECFEQGAAKYNLAHTTSVEPFGLNVLPQDPFSPERLSVIAGLLHEQGADVVLPLAAAETSEMGSGAEVSVLAENAVNIIGVSYDWAWAFPDLAGKVLTSIETRFDRSIAVAVGALGEKNASGWRHQGTIASGEVGLAARGADGWLADAVLEELIALVVSPDPICQIIQPDVPDAPAPTASATSAPTATETLVPTATATATPSPTPTLDPAQKINMYGLAEAGISQVEFPASQPFYIEHGFVFPVGEAAPDVQVFYLEIDGDPVELTSLNIKPMGSDEVAHFSFYYFPEGMTGTHTFVGSWRIPDGPTTSETLVVVFVP